ncbi:MAG: chemotaxis protein CheB, partial [Leptothrix sp. (in: b-proteobacteria)]
MTLRSAKRAPSGIGASADSGAAYVVVPHLDPTHPAMLVELLQRITAMPVREAADAMALEAGSGTGTRTRIRPRAAAHPVGPGHAPRRRPARPRSGAGVDPGAQSAGRPAARLG